MRFLASSLFLLLTVPGVALAQDAPAAPPEPFTPEPGTEPRPEPASTDAKKSALPVPYVERPLTLPEMTLSPHFSGGLTHVEFGGLGGGAVNLINLDAGASFGILDDLTVYAQPLTMLIGVADGGSEVWYGTFRLGAIYRFLSTEVVDIGGQFEFGATGASDTIHLTGKLPVLLRFADLVRIDTGLALSGYFSTQGGGAAGGLAQIGTGSTPLGPNGAGIPVSVSFQLAEPVFLGLDTGFGIADFEDAGDSMFMPLGAHVGGTIASDDRPIVDLVGRFNFPAFLVSGDPEPPLTEIWQVGLDARAYFDLGG
jgi:hypothetical protein